MSIIDDRNVKDSTFPAYGTSREALKRQTALECHQTSGGEELSIKKLIDTCGKITEEKQFDTTQIRTQIALFVTEIAELLEHVSNSSNIKTDIFTWELMVLSANYELYRQNLNSSYRDASRITNKEDFLEELADIQIRLASFIYGNKLTDDFLEALISKIEKNKARPIRHGKCF